MSVVFTASGSWLCPIGVTSIDVEAWGGGGSGGVTKTQRACGGGGGGYSKKTGITVIPGNSYTINVGTGGAGVSGASAESNGNPGGDSYFNNVSTVLAKGGQAGSFGNAIGPALGGQASAGVGDVKHSGGNSNVENTGQTTAGGGGAGDSNDGTNGGELNSPGSGGANFGGNGTAGVTSGGTSGNAATFGGGSGGANGSGSPTSGSGARGQVNLIYIDTAAIDTNVTLDNISLLVNVIPLDVNVSTDTDKAEYHFSNQKKTAAPTWNNTQKT